MAGKLSAKAQQKVDTLEEASRKTDRIASLIEQFATARQPDSYANLIRNAATDVGRVFMRDGLGVLAETANQISTLSTRGGATQAKFRTLRELVGSLSAGVDRASKAVLAAERNQPD